MVTFTVHSELAVAPAEFWRFVSLDRVNAELSPLVRMWARSEWRTRPLEDWPTGRRLFRSVILLFGFVPVDVHAFRLEEVARDRGFVERSSSWLNRTWQHERRTEPADEGCVLIDTVTVASRLPGFAQLMLPVYRMIFRHRHRKLRSWFPAGGPRPELGPRWYSGSGVP